MPVIPKSIKSITPLQTAKGLKTRDNKRTDKYSVRRTINWYRDER